MFEENVAHLLAYICTHKWLCGDLFLFYISYIESCIKIKASYGPSKVLLKRVIERNVTVYIRPKECVYFLGLVSYIWIHEGLHSLQCM